MGLINDQSINQPSGSQPFFIWGTLAAEKKSRGTLETEK